MLKTNLAIELSNIVKNCCNDVWYITLTMLISTIKKYIMLPRVATGLYSSRASLIFTSVSRATKSFSLTSSAVNFVVFNTSINDSSSTSEPFSWRKDSMHLESIIYHWCVYQSSFIDRRLYFISITKFNYWNNVPNALEKIVIFN